MQPVSNRWLSACAFFCALGAACHVPRAVAPVAILAIKDGSPRGTLGPYLVDFGRVPVGSVNSRSITVLDLGDGQLEIDSPVVASPFGVPSTEIKPIPAGSEALLGFSFAPAAEGAFETTVTLSSNGGTAKVVLQGEGVVLPEPCLWTLQPSHLDFGAVRIGDARRLTATIRNNGGAACVVSEIALDPSSDSGFQLMPPPDITLDPGEELAVQVTFKTTQPSSISLGRVLFRVSDPGTLSELPLTATSSWPCPNPEPDGSCPKAEAPVYLNTGTELYTYDLSTNSIRLVGAFSGADAIVMLDIAVDSSGVLMGVSAGNLYAIHPRTAVCTRVKPVEAFANGLSFLPDGRLVVGGSSLEILDRGTWEDVAVVVPAGHYSTSGDLVTLPDGFIYWSVLGTGGGDPLVRVDPATGETEVVTSLPVSGVFGLSYARGMLLGFTEAGESLIIDTTTFNATVHPLPGQWYGAATNPTAWDQSP